MRSLRPFATAAALVSSLILTACGHAVGQNALYASGTGLASLSAKHATANGRSLYVLPGGGEELLVSGISHAKKSVRLAVYMLTEQPLVDAMIAAKGRGVDVEVMLEPHPYNPANPNVPLPTNHKAFNALVAAGIHCTDTSPAFTYTHAKYMSVDDATTYVSTANFTKSGLNGNREYIVVDQVAADVAEFVRIFQADQARQDYQPVNPSGVVSPVNSRKHIFDLVASAKHDVLLADEVAGDPAFTDLIKQTCARGVKVRALLGAMKPTANDPEPLNVATARAWTAAGAQVRFQSVPVLHAKAIVVDGKAMYVGSENLTSNSLDHNREIGLLLSDAALIAPVVAATEGDWKNASTGLTADATEALAAEL